LIIVQPGSDLFKIESFLPLGSALFMAFSYLSLRFVMKTDSSISIIFYYSLALLITTLIFFPSNFIIPDFIDFIFLFSLGIMGSLGHYFISQAAKNADVVVISPFEYTSFLFVAGMGYYFYNEIPSNSIFLGGALIIISGLYIAYNEHSSDKHLR